MPANQSPETTEDEHSYIDVGPVGPRRWVLAIGAVLIVLALVAAFYGLYAINQSPSPTLSPDPALLTQETVVETPDRDQAFPSATPAFVTATPISTTTPAITTTAEPPTYTVRQGDSLIVIANRLNVDVDHLTALNRLTGEAIFPNQVLLVPPTVTPWPETGPFPHIVSQGETLIAIAARYGVTLEGIKALNGLTSDTIFSGQKILIPAGGIRPPTPTPTPEPWRPAIITGELDAVYSLTTIKGHFTLHIPPDARAAPTDETSKIARLVETALDHSQRVLRRRLTGRFEVYVADTLFDAPRTLRRSFSLADQSRLFLLYDGSGTPSERLYFITYALTPLVATRTLGQAASPLLGEGLAVYVAGQALASESGQGGRYLLPAQFCSAYQQAGQLPRVSRELNFDGHLGHLDQYLAAGCFVGYLIEEKGASAFGEVYLDGDYSAAYGQSLNQLESDWIVSLRDAAAELPFAPDELVQIVTAVDDAYRRLWAGFAGTPAQFTAYQRLDRARLSLLQGRLGAAREHLELFETLLGDQ